MSDYLKKMQQTALDIKGYDSFYERLNILAQKSLLPPVVLLHGTKGAGKTFALVQVARVLLCENRSGCGACQSCLEISDGRHPDLLVMDAEENSKVEAVKVLQEFVSFSPERHLRIVCLFNVDALNISSVNRLLKTLEEPEENILFLLSSNRIKALLPTLKSRCVLWPAPKVSGELTREIVQNSADHLEPSISQPTVEMLVKRYDGAPGLCIEELHDEAFTNIQKICKFVLHARKLGQLGEIHQKIGQSKVPVIQYLNELEYCLNEYYKSQLEKGNLDHFQILGNRRKVIRRVRSALKNNQGLPLNASMFLEAVAGSQLQE